MLESLELPDNLQDSHQLLCDMAAAYDRLQEVYEELLDTCTSMQESRTKLEQEREELQLTIRELTNRLYGRRTERHEYDPLQMPLDFGDDDVVEVLPDLTEDEEFVEAHQDKKRRRRKKKTKADAGRFPEHLERRVERMEPNLPDGVRLEDCDLLGIDIVEILEIDRARLWVRRLEYPKYKIPTQPERNIVQAARGVYSIVPGGSFGFGIAAEVLFNKFGLHVPLYRQQDPFAQFGWAPSRSTLCHITSTSADQLLPLAMLETERVLAACVVNTDDTEVRLLTPGEGKGSRKARLWIYRSNEANSQYDVFAFTNSRSRAGPNSFLQDFQGTITGDCYSGYVNIETATDGRIGFSACNTHSRRYVFNAREQDPGLSSQIIASYRALYDIEDRIRHRDPAERLAVRRRESVSLMKRIESLLYSSSAMKLLPKSKLGSALFYMRNNWTALKRFLSDGRLPIDNNEAEHALRRIALGRKNWLFVGSERGGERMAVIFTIVASAHRHDLDVCAYLRDVLERLAKGDCELEQLLPDVWKANHPEHVRTFREEERQQRADERRYRRAKRRIEKAELAAR
jgi:transposase